MAKVNYGGGCFITFNNTGKTIHNVRGLWQDGEGDCKWEQTDCRNDCRRHVIQLSLFALVFKMLQEMNWYCMYEDTQMLASRSADGKRKPSSALSYKCDRNIKRSPHCACKVIKEAHSLCHATCGVWSIRHSAMLFMPRLHLWHPSCNGMPLRVRACLFVCLMRCPQRDLIYSDHTHSPDDQFIPLPDSAWISEGGGDRRMK